MCDRNPYDLRAKYTHFRILIIGRANAGKTTILQRVCNTTEDPCIYDENNKNSLEPTPARGIHDIHRPFAFRSNPGFIFHDSPGFETGDKKQLQEVLSFIEEKAKSRDVDDQLHAIWFCFVLNNARPLLPLETEFFETARAGKVPVIAIFTKFDDLMTQVYDIDKDDDVNRQNAEVQVEKRFRNPLYGYTFPPRADVCFEDLHTAEIGKHQDQVKVLIEKTASSLDDTALKMLFVSVQQNNIELCVRYAIDDLSKEIGVISAEVLILRTMIWFGHSFLPGYNYSKSDIYHDRRERRRELYQRLQKRDQQYGGKRDHYHRLGQDAKTLVVFLHANFECNDSSSSSKSTVSYLKQELFFPIFAALLLCMENTFWNISTDINFVDLFKTSFTLYVESGIRKKMEVAIDGLRNEQSGWMVPVTKDFKAKFRKIIIEHCLPHPESQAFGLELENGMEQENEKKFTWLQRLMQKIRRTQSV